MGLKLESFSFTSQHRKKVTHMYIDPSCNLTRENVEQCQYTFCLIILQSSHTNMHCNKTKINFY